MFADSFKMLIWKGLTVFVSAFTAVLLARWLGPELRGELAILLLTLSLATLIFQLGFPEASIYILGSNDQDSRTNEFVVIGIGLAIAMLFMILTAALVTLVSPINIGLYLLLSLTGGISILVTFLRHVFLAKKFFHLYSITIATEVLVYVVGISSLKFLGELNLFGAVMAYCLSLFLAFLVSILLLDIDFRQEHKEPIEIRKILKMCIAKGRHFFIVGLGGFGTQRLNYFLLEHLSGIRSVGLFSAASTLPSFIGMIPQQVATVAYSHVATSGEEKSPLRLVKSVLQVLFAGVVMAVVVVAFYADSLVVLVFGPEFSSIADTMVMLCLAAGLNGIGSICVNALAGFGMPQIGTYMTMISIPCILIFGVILIPIYGLLGAALSLLGTSFLTLGFVMVSIHRVSGGSISDFFTIR